MIRAVKPQTCLFRRRMSLAGVKMDPAIPAQLTETRVPAVHPTRTTTYASHLDRTRQGREIRVQAPVRPATIRAKARHCRFRAETPQTIPNQQNSEYAASPTWTGASRCCAGDRNDRHRAYHVAASVLGVGLERPRNGPGQLLANDGLNGPMDVPLVQSYDHHGILLRGNPTC